MEKPYRNPEPVPSASQLALLPFAAAIEGFLRNDSDIPGLRLTLHRTMSREGNGYLQQVCAYLGGKEPEWRGQVGRLFAVTFGIMGAAYDAQKIYRTKKYQSLEELHRNLQKSMQKTGDDRKLTEVGLSYLAIPFLGPQDQVVLILYAECKQLNFFADDDRVRNIAAMCQGVCRLFDWLQGQPMPNLRNFPLLKGRPVTEPPTVYSLIQEAVDISPPRFTLVPSFNYEAAAA
jgi:hypothetical protein